MSMSYLKMLVLCLFAILVSVQCAPQEYSNSRTSTRRTFVEAYYTIQDVSRDFRSAVETVVEYLEDTTCLRFKEVPLETDGNSLAPSTLFVFSETKKPLINCFTIHKKNVLDNIAFVTLNEECAKQKVKDRRAGKEDSRIDLNDVLYSRFCFSMPR